jgi:hypothetical protein
MENVLKAVKDSFIEMDKSICEDIALYKKMVEDDTDQPSIDLTKLFIKHYLYLHILSKGVIDNVLNIDFYRSCKKNIESNELEVIEFINQLTIKYDLEENTYLEACEKAYKGVKQMKYFVDILEDANLRPEKYNY